MVKIGSHRCWDWAGDTCVYFTKPSDGLNDRTHVLNPEGWRAWAKKSGARPVGAAP